MHSMDLAEKVSDQTAPPGFKWRLACGSDSNHRRLRSGPDAPIAFAPSHCQGLSYPTNRKCGGGKEGRRPEKAEQLMQKCERV